MYSQVYSQVYSQLKHNQNRKILTRRLLWATRRRIQIELIARAIKFEKWSAIKNNSSEELRENSHKSNKIPKADIFGGEIAEEYRSRCKINVLIYGSIAIKTPP